MSEPLTRLYATLPNGHRRLMAEIGAASKYFGFNAPSDLHLEENRTKCAILIRDGWIHNGGMHECKWEIEQGRLSRLVKDGRIVSETWERSE